MPEEPTVEHGIAFVVRYADMHRFCMNRSDCLGCPYFKRKVCDKMSFEEAIYMAADYLRRFVDVKGPPVIG
jgi:hypothetical protein